jgi:hypothetical protein
MLLSEAENHIRSPMDVNLEGLDQIIDGGMRVRLSSSDGEKLKAALRAGRSGGAPLAHHREDPRRA